MNAIDLFLQQECFSVTNVRNLHTDRLSRTPASVHIHQEGRIKAEGQVHVADGRRPRLRPKKEKEHPQISFSIRH